MLVAGVGLAYYALRNATVVTPTPANGAPTRGAGSIDVILNAAESHRRQGDFAAAETILKAALAEHPDEQTLNSLYAEVLLGLKRPAEAYSAYEKALAIGPRTPALEFAAGTCASMSGKLERALEHYSAAQAGNPTDWQAPLFLAQVQIKLDQVEDAKKNLLLAGRLKPDAGIVWGTLAELALRENKLSLAEQHIARARELEPQVTLWKVIQARALKRDNKPEEALLLLVGLDVQDLRGPGVLGLMGECYGLLNRPGDAALLYTRVADSDPTRGDIALDAALWLEKVGDRARALEYARRAQAAGNADAASVIARLSP